MKTKWISEKQLDVIEFMRSINGPMTAKEIGRGANLKTPYPYHTLNLLVRRGIIREVVLPCRPVMYEVV